MTRKKKKNKTDARKEKVTGVSERYAGDSRRRVPYVDLEMKVVLQM